MAIGGGLPKNVEWGAFGTDIFLGEDCLVDGWPVAIGDEVVMEGRFITLHGAQRNNPVVRFGNISMMPSEAARVECNGIQQIAFLVDCRSLSGFSGSPAMVQLVQTRALEPDFAPPDRLSGKAIAFLGIVCAHLPFWNPVYVWDDKLKKKLPSDTLSVETNGGIAVVIPAWRLLAMLMKGHLMEEREKRERRREEQDAKPVLDVAAPEGESSITKDEFLDALKRVSRKQSDEEKS